MSDAVRARHDALRAIGNALANGSALAATGLSQFDTSARHAREEASSEVRRRQHRVQAARVALQQADEEHQAACQAQLAAAERSLAAAQKALGIINTQWDQFVARRRRFDVRMNDLIDQGRAELRRLGQHLDSYNGAGGSLFAAASNAAAAVDGSAAPGGRLETSLAAVGLELVNVGDIEPGTGVGGDHGRSSVDYRWLMEKWDTVISPGIASGMGRDDFAADDARMGSGEGRRLVDVYDVMLSRSPIDLEVGLDGRLSISGGHHRVRHAQDLGIDQIPARVHRSNS